MLLEVIDKEKETSFVIEVRDEYVEAVSRVVPFKSTAKTWKEEVYFETPIASLAGTEVRRVERGRVYFWPPGRAMCMFYGLSQIYTPGIEIGTLVDPPNRLVNVSDGDEVEVVEHRISKELSDIADRLSGEGFRVATPLDQGVRVVTALKVISGDEIRLTIFVEDYGVHVESEALAKYSSNLSDLIHLNKLKRVVESLTDMARLDVSEEGYVVVTACGDRKEVAELVNEVARATWLVKRSLFY